MPRLGLGDIRAEHLVEAFKDRANARVGKAITDRAAIAITGHEPLGAQSGKLAGHIRLARTQHVLKITYAALAWQKRA